MIIKGNNLRKIEQCKKKRDITWGILKKKKRGSKVIVAKEMNIYVKWQRKIKEKRKRNEKGKEEREKQADLQRRRRSSTSGHDCISVLGDGGDRDRRYGVR